MSARFRLGAGETPEDVLQRALTLRAAHHITDRSDGDQLARSEFRERPVTWLRQVHGNKVVIVSRPGQHAGDEADAVVSTAAGCVLAIRTADCASIVLDGGDVVGVVHAGWRGLVLGVIDNAMEAMRAVGAADVKATIGPCIRAGCYEFGADALETAAAMFGDVVRATTMWGTPALDVTAGVRVALERHGIGHIEDGGACTACDPARWYSYRARAESERMATYAWLEQ